MPNLRAPERPLFTISLLFLNSRDTREARDRDLLGRSVLIMPSFVGAVSISVCDRPTVQLLHSEYPGTSGNKWDGHSLSYAYGSFTTYLLIGLRGLEEARGNSIAIESNTVVSGYKPWARSAWQRDNTRSGTQNGAFVSDVFGSNKFTFSDYLMLTVSVIINRSLCGENAVKVMIHYLLWVVFYHLWNSFRILAVKRVINSKR